MTGQMIDITAADGRFVGYLSVPKAGSGPGLVLLHTAFGLDRHMRDVADFYAAEGYVVLCPDLYWRIEPGLDLRQSDADRQKALALYEKFDLATAIPDIAAAVATLRGRPECSGKVGALGFCMGGGLAYRAAALCGIDCAVSYYGTRIDEALDLAPRIACPVVLHFARNDDYVPAETVAQVKSTFAGRDQIEIYEYPGVGHGFNRPDGGDYDKPAASMAQTRTIALLRRVMGPHYDLAML